MKFWEERVQIWVYTKRVDFRKQLNGLIELVETKMEKRPNDGSVYVFRNRKGDKTKLIVWDRNGFWMMYKRLEKGKFDFPVDPAEIGRTLEISASQYEMLVSGMPVLRYGIAAEKEVVFS